MAKSNVAWDLSEIFPSLADPAVQKAFDDITAMAESFAKKYQGEIKGFSAEELQKCLEDFEAYYARLMDVSLFAYLSFAANMTLPETQLLHDKALKLEAKLGKLLAFFELEVGDLVHTNAQLISNPVLSNYRHALEKLRRRVPHQLSEVEEKLIIEKDQFGVVAWEELQTKWLNTRMFEVQVEGVKKTMSFGEAYGLFSYPDRATRESAYKAIFSVVGRDGEIFSSALRNICNDWLSVCERRKYHSPVQASLITNDVDERIIDSLLKTVESNVNLYQRYLRLKAKIMGLPKLGCHDILAPLPGAPAMTFDFVEARDLVARAYGKFDEDYAFAARDMFARNHIDAMPRFGKQNGAFCAGWYDGKSAFMLQSFNGRLNDVYTLAHELGHATHDYYSEKSGTVMNMAIPMVVAETASIFGELLVTDLLISEAKSDAEKRVILCKVLDGAGRTTFSVSSRAWFEQSVYDAVKRGEYLDYNTVCKYWMAARNKAYGDTVDWFGEMESEWGITPHYFMANLRFYNYPYVYAQMFVYALYQRYLQESKAFVPKFVKILSAGGSISPVEIGKIVGLDVSTREFWNLGMKQFEHFLGELEKIVK